MEFEDDELIPQNLDLVENLVNYISIKKKNIEK